MENLTIQPELVSRYEKRRNLFLVLSIMFDAMGLLSYFVPALGETGDVAWAPIAGFIMYIMYGGFLGVFGGVFVFLEELIPFTDFIPGFLIMWFVKYVVFAKKSKREFMEKQSDGVEKRLREAKSIPLKS